MMHHVHDKIMAEGRLLIVPFVIGSSMLFKAREMMVELPSSNAVPDYHLKGILSNRMIKAFFFFL